MSKWKLSVTLLTCALVMACQPPKDATGKNKEEEKAPEPVPVEVSVAKRGDVNALYTGTATLEADGEAQVKAKVGGEIIKLFVEEGEMVKAGQAIAKIDDARLRLEVQRAKANVDKVRQDYARNVELHEKGLLPAGTFEGVKFDLEGLQASYELSQLELSYTTIRAPISGVISERFVKPGNNINVGETLFTVTDLDPLLAYLHIPERDFQKLLAKQSVDLYVDALPDRIFTGVIARISPVVNAATGTFKVTIEMQDNEYALKPGMFGRVAIIYETFDNAVLVPRNAVVDNDGNKSVFLIEGSTAKRREILTGHVSGANVQVTQGLEGGETIVVIGQNGLKDDGLVKVVNALPDQKLDQINNNGDSIDSNAQTELAKTD